MGLSYTDFRAYLTTFLWRDNDAVLTANLGSLIKMADAELNRVFKVEERTVTADAQITDNILTVPLDYREMRNLSMPGFGTMTYLSPLEFARQDARNVSGQRMGFFTVSNNLIRLSGRFSTETPQPVTMVYYANLPDYQLTGASWVADLYLDVYAYCVLKHAAPFLREDDRLQIWASLYTDALEGALAENANRKYTGSPQRLTFAGMP